MLATYCIKYHWFSIFAYPCFSQKMFCNIQLVHLWKDLADGKGKQQLFSRHTQIHSWKEETDKYHFYLFWYIRQRFSLFFCQHSSSWPLWSILALKFLKADRRLCCATVQPECERAVVVVIQPWRKVPTQGGNLTLLLIEIGREINTILQVLLGFVLESVCILITYVSER